ncbi:MAG: SusC/RagA family TonB-linked outer membrane protein [Calditrichales bacterium]|nr:SusC/RagA family TonB-linked outer membrane protein [Calditrichales bacterium]
MTKKLFVFLVSLIFILTTGLSAFAVDIKGIVIDSRTDEPLGGVNIYIEDTNVGTTTDQDGYFSFSYDTDTGFNLILNYVGYKNVTLTLSPTDDLSGLEVKMNEDIFKSETIVVTGIASKTSKDVAEVAVSRIVASEYTELTSYQDISQLVTGKISGVQLKPSSGNVGGGFRFFMRSGGGVGGDEQPVIYVDGVRIDNTEVVGYGTGGQGMSALANLNPEDIENIEVLKGPAGASSYGVNGSNGVILITTKRGKLVSAKGGKVKRVAIDYKFIRGLNTQSYEYKEENFESYKDANRNFQDGDITQHSISASGGSNFLKYYTSFDSRDEEGLFPNNWLDRKSARLNISAFPSEKVTLQVTSGYSYTKMSRPWNDNNIYGYLGNTLLFPTSYNWNDSLSIRSMQDNNDINRFIGSAKVTYTPIKNLEAQVGIGIDASNWRQDQLYPADRPYMLVNNGRRNIWNRENRQFTYDFNLNYKYEIIPGLKAVSIIGSQVFDRKVSTSQLSAEGFDTELITDIGAAAEFKEKDESKLHGRDAGIFFEQNLSYNDQYYLTLGLRKDYASAIGETAPSIMYPKTSLAVRMDRYDFTPSVFDLLKLRLAYGESGLLPGSIQGIPFLWEAQTGGYGAGAVISSIGNAELEPERIKEFEMGFETEFFTNYAIEFTYYRQYASNSIFGREESPSTGLTASSVPFNVGAMESWGFESLIQATPIRTRNYGLDLSFIWNYQTNEVTDLGGAQPVYNFDINVIKEGLAKHEFHTWRVDGAEFDVDGVYTGPKVYVTPDTTDDDRVSIGNPLPNHTGSFSMTFRFLKNFRFYALCDWALGHKLLNYTSQFATILGNNPKYNKLANQLDMAGGSALDTTITRLTPGTDAYIEAANDYAKLDTRYDGNYVQEADYLKFREISISYSFKDILAKYPRYQIVDDVILGFSARNLITFTKYEGADVEVNVEGARGGTRGVDFLTLQSPTVYNFWLKIAL